MSGIDKAIKHFGGQRRLADKLGVRPPTVHQWRNGQRPVPVLRCLQIERLSGGAVSAHEIRDDVDWSEFDRPAMGRARVLQGR